MLTLMEMCEVCENPCERSSVRFRSLSTCSAGKMHLNAQLKPMVTDTASSRSAEIRQGFCVSLFWILFRFVTSMTSVSDPARRMSLSETIFAYVPTRIIGNHFSSRIVKSRPQTDTNRKTPWA